MVCAEIVTGSLEREVMAYLSTVSEGSAGADSDYTTVTSLGVTFVSGQSDSSMSTQCVELAVLDDDILEGSENFTVRLTNQSNLVYVDIKNKRELAEVVIREDNNDNVVIGFSAGETLTATERINTSIVVCTQILEGVLERDVSIFASTRDDSAIASVDYTKITSKEITFTAGQTVGSTQCIAVVLLDDNNVLETVETFEVVLSSSESFIVFLPEQESLVITIEEDPLDGITVALQQTTYITAETDGPLSVCLQMFVGNLQRNVSLSVITTNGSAISPGDYTFLANNQIVFTVGQTAGAIVCTSLDIIDDNVVETNEESFTLMIVADDPPVTTVTASSATVLIRENDNDVTGSIALTASNYDAYESDGEVSVCAAINAAALERDVVVQVSSQDFTARNTEDYTAFQFVQLTFVSGSIFGDEICHNVSINDDNVLENDEVFSVTLTSTESASLGSNSTQTIVTIRHDPADFLELGFLQDSYSISEELQLSEARICVIINRGVLERDVVVNVVTTDITAEVGLDYGSPAPATLTFISGQTVGGQRCTVLNVLDDLLIEEEETVNVTLSVSLSDEDSVRFTTGESFTTVTIVQDPLDKAEIRLLNSTGSHDEGQDISICAELVTIDGRLSRPLSVSSNILSVTAEDGVDFNSSTSGELLFPTGSAQGEVQCFTIILLTDLLLEEPENFVVELFTSDPAVTITETSDIAIITINDVPEPRAVAVSIVDSDYNATEGVAITVEVCVEVVFGEVSQLATVELQTVSGSATGNQDFSSETFTLTFLPGEIIGSTPRCVLINILDDVIVENVEEFSVILSTTSEELQTINTTSVNITIFEDPSDVVTVGLQPLTTSVSENETFQVCAVLTSGSLERDVFIGIEAENSTAIQGVDFIGPDPSVLRFTSGQSQGDIQCTKVTILDDTVVEGESNFTIRLFDLGDGSDGGGGGEGVQVDANVSEISIDIAIDISDIIIVGLSSTSYSVTEGPLLGPNAVVKVCATIQLGSVGRDVAVKIFTPVTGSVITATLNLDFIPIAELLVFTEGQGRGDSSCTEITIVSDFFLEMEEVFEVVLIPNPEDLLAAIIQAGKDRAFITISDSEDEGNSVSVQPSSPEVVVSEGGSVDGGGTGGDPQAMVCIELTSGNLQRNVSVRVMTISSPTATATVNEDYLEIDMNVTFTSGQNATGDNMQCVFIPLIDDTVLEGNETFDVLLTTTTEDEGLVNVTAQDITVTIEEDPNDFVEVGIRPLNATVSENDTFSVCVELTAGSLERNVTVPLVVEAGSAAEGVDFVGPDPSNLTFTSGQSMGDIQCAEITILDDDLPQGERNFSIYIGSGDGGRDGRGGVRVNANLPSINIQIDLDIEDTIFVGLSSLMHDVIEGSNAVASVCATIEIAIRPLRRDTSVIIVTPLVGTSDTATPFLDFIPITEKVTFTEGQSQGDSVCANITIIQDVFVETKETFEVRLLPDPDNLLGAIIQPSKAVAIVTISDGEMDRNVNVAPSSPDIPTVEGGGDNGGTGGGDGGDGEVMVCLELTNGNLQRNVTLTAMTVSSPTSTAIVNEDYLDVEVNVTFTSGQNASGDNEQCFSIPILNDNILECNETFEIDLSPISDDVDIVNITNRVFTVTIEEDPNDFVEVALIPINRPVTENETFPVCVQITSGILGCNISVPFVVQNGSGLEGVDFIGPTPSVMIFTVGQTVGDMQCADITILDDFAPQGERNFSISIGLDAGIIGPGGDSGGGDGGNGGRGGGVRTNANFLSISITIDFDIEDLIVVGLSQLTYEVSEGPNAVATVCATIEVALGSVSKDTIVNLVTPLTGAAVTATPILDFIPITEQLTFAKGQSQGESVCANIMIIQDVFVETMETFEVMLLPDTNDILGAIIQPSKAKAIVTISDGEMDRNVNVRPSVPSISTLEGGGTGTGGGGNEGVGGGVSDGNGDGGTMDNGQVEVCIELSSGNLQRNVSVNVATVSSPTSTATATVNEDYISVDINITFTSGQNASGDNQQCFYITILNDNILECNETFDVVITAVTDDEDVVNVTAQVITVTIEEDPNDYAEVGLVPLNHAVSENETFSICAQITAGLLGCNISVPLDITTQGNSTVAGVDFIGPYPSILIFTVGQTVGDIQCAEFSVPDDSYPQGERSFNVSIGDDAGTIEYGEGDGGDDRDSGRGGSSGGGVQTNPNLPSVTVDIDIDINDIIQVGLAEIMYEATEAPNAQVSICVDIELGTVNSETTTVHLVTPPSGASTATPVLDYTPISEALTFTKGQSQGDSLCTPITIIQDVFVEAIETFEVTLLPTPEDLFKILFVTVRKTELLLPSLMEKFTDLWPLGL